MIERKLISCKEYYQQRKLDLLAQIQSLDKKIILTIIKVGQDNASDSYFKGKVRDCTELGIDIRYINIPDDTTTNELIDIVESENKTYTTGIIIQLPLPSHIDYESVKEHIDKEKDVDGFRLESEFKPCTARGIVDYLEFNGVILEGLDTTIVGRSEIVGKPLADLLLEKNSTVTICHSKTKNIRKHTLNSDIIIVAVGKEKVITEDMIGDNRPIVLDVGINHNTAGKLCGDTDYTKIKDKCSYCTPVPGGVGLLTRIALIDNLYETSIK